MNRSNHQVGYLDVRDPPLLDYLIYTLTMCGLVFGPRLFGSLFLDFTILPVIWLGAILFFRDLRINISKYLLTVSISLLFVTILAISVGLWNESPDIIHVFKLLRSLLGGLSLVLLTVWLSDKRISKEIFLNIFISSVVLHALIVISQFVFPDIDALIQSISGYQGTSKRPTGLTWSLNASAVPHAFAVFCLMIKDDRSYIKIAIILIAMALMGRTAFILTLALLSLWQITKFNIKSVLMATLVATVIASILISNLDNWAVILKDSGANNQLFQYVQILQFLFGSISLDDTTYLRPLLETLKTFLFVPQNTVDLFIGAGISGRESVYIKSDMGWVLNLFSFGLFGIAIFIWLHIYLVWSCRKTAIYAPVFLIVALIFLMNFTENLLFARHVSAVFFVCLCYVGYPKLRGQ